MGAFAEMAAPSRLQGLPDTLNRITDLPTVPAVAIDVLNKAMDPESTAEQIAEIVKKDASLSVNILKIVNTPVYGFASRVYDVKHAIAALGCANLRNVVMATSAIGAFQGLKGNPIFDRTNFWRHSLACASAAREVVKGLLPTWSADAYLAGLLHDIGKLVLDVYMAGEYETVLNLALESDDPIVDIERNTLGVDHGAVGG
jgi:HD-like signal output (HDOD) protein